MNNITYSEKFMSKTQEHTVAWVPCKFRQPGWSGYFLVTLQDGSVTIEYFNSQTVPVHWSNSSVIAWGKLIEAYKP